MVLGASRGGAPLQSYRPLGRLLTQTSPDEELEALSRQLYGTAGVSHLRLLCRAGRDWSGLPPASLLRMPLSSRRFAASLAHLLRKGELEVLELGFAPPVQALVAISSALRWGFRLRRLSLSGAVLDEACMIALCSGLRDSPWVESLSLSSCGLNDACVGACATRATNSLLVLTGSACRTRRLTAARTRAPGRALPLARRAAALRAWRD